MLRKYCFTLLMLLPLSGNATMVTLEAPTSVAAGTVFDVQVFGEFGDLGMTLGGFDFIYDSMLASIVDYQSALTNDPDFSCPGAAGCLPDPGGIFMLAWGGNTVGGFFDPLILPGAGPTLMGTITMMAGSEAGILDLQMLQNPDFFGGWGDADFMPMPPPDLFGTTVNIIVPEPATTLLMLVGLGALFNARRDRGRSVI